MQAWVRENFAWRGFHTEIDAIVPGIARAGENPSKISCGMSDATFNIAMEMEDQPRREVSRRDSI